MKRPEPIQESRFEYKGLHCVVLFQQMAFRTGYVGIPKGHKYYGKDYDSIPVDCHCGLTYSDSRLFGQNDTDTWWIGFDCGHCCDGFDVEKAKEYYADNNQVMIMLIMQKDYFAFCNKYNPIRTKEYVEENCRQIVDQLLKESEE